ncbi:Facilitated trehalose transporter Tret1 [Folsomia candida]|uniref:Facilitated trehalose transporter Tret1 n=1 Tax=Folsomia candida TaxID=158441 RepID=A0A226F0D1_FOLCA|nr:Facilitated trehalose transporter Tret1 [Folsomia candida]
MRGVDNFENVVESEFELKVGISSLDGDEKDGQDHAVQNWKDEINGSYSNSTCDHISNDDNGGQEDGSQSQDLSEKSQFKDKYAPQFFAALAANFGSFALGSVLSWTSVALPDLRERKSIGEISDFEETWISSIALLGATASCTVVGLMMEKFGRRKCFCGGGCSIVVPVYITETASVKIRGMLASGFDMLITVGILYIFIIGTYVNWQYQAVACGVIPIVFHAFMMFAPESPRYLVEQRKLSDASKALCWLRGAKSTQHIQREMNELVSSVDESMEKSASWRDIIKDGSILKPTIIALMLMVFQQLSAIDAVMFYTVDIFRAAGTDIDENLSANIVGTVQVLATITAALFVDHSGRRCLLLISEIGMVISLGGMGAFFYLKQQNNDEVPANLSWLPLASLMVHTMAFSVGMGYSLYPGMASGLVTITRWILGFAVTMVFKEVMKILGMHGGYWLFSAFCFLGTIFVFYFVPETKGKSLDEIQEFFKSPQQKNRGASIEGKPEALKV